MFEALRPIIQNMLSGKVPLPGARSTPFGVARRLALAGIGWSAKPFIQYNRPGGLLRGAQ